MGPQLVNLCPTDLPEAPAFPPSSPHTGHSRVGKRAASRCHGPTELSGGAEVKLSAASEHCLAAISAPREDLEHSRLFYRETQLIHS